MDRRCSIMSMTRERLKALLIKSAMGQASTEFSAEQVDSAALNAFKEFAGFEDMTIGEIRHSSGAYFAIIEEVINEVVPQQLTNVIGDFAEIRTFAYTDQPIFTIKDLGGARIRRAIVQGARAGVYKSHRLDNRNMEVTSRVETIGVTLSLEDFLTGRVTLADYMKQVTQGFEEIVYKNVIVALRQGANEAPLANKAVSAGSDLDLAGLDKVIRIVGAYGTPRLFAFESLANEISNASTLNSNGVEITGTSRQDWDDIRDYGRVMRYKGRVVTIIPNFLTDTQNTGWLFKENQLFVLPVNEKPVKVAFHGDTIMTSFSNPVGGQEWNMSRGIGVGVLANNYIGSLTYAEAEEGIY